MFFWGDIRVFVCVSPFLFLFSCVPCSFYPKWLFFPNLSLLGYFIMWKWIFPLEKFTQKWTLLKIKNPVELRLELYLSYWRGRWMKEVKKQILKSPHAPTNHHFSRFSLWKDLRMSWWKWPAFRMTPWFSRRTNSAFLQNRDLRLQSEQVGAAVLCHALRGGGERCGWVMMTLWAALGLIWVHGYPCVAHSILFKADLLKVLSNFAAGREHLVSLLQGVSVYSFFSIYTHGDLLRSATWYLISLSQTSADTT